LRAVADTSANKTSARHKRWCGIVQAPRVVCIVEVPTSKLAKVRALHAELQIPVAHLHGAILVWQPVEHWARLYWKWWLGKFSIQRVLTRARI
jgi:hypothetical protein